MNEFREAVRLYLMETLCGPRKNEYLVSHKVGECIAVDFPYRHSTVYLHFLRGGFIRLSVNGAGTDPPPGFRIDLSHPRAFEMLSEALETLFEYELK